MLYMIYRILKRTFDLISSSIALVISSPLWIMIALGIKISSPGPVFYTSIRSGKNHREFTMYKFRSMHVYKPESSDSGKRSEGTFIANEQRIFRLGNFLRKSKLDELPQLLNVFIGQMSVIGPRPYTEKTIRKIYFGNNERIMTVKPGLAGLDSLFDYTHGELFVSNNDEYIHRVLPIRTELAGMYVDRQSLFLDAYCIVRTLRLIFEIVFLQRRNFPYTRFEEEAREIVLNRLEEEERINNGV